MTSTSKAYDRLIDEALDKMFQAVGFEKYDYEFTLQPNWYTLREWTPEQESKFKTWFLSALKKRLKYNDYSANKVAGFFLLNYGWKTKFEPKDTVPK